MTDSIRHIAERLLRAEFNPGDDTFKGVSKDIHNACLDAGWRPPNRTHLGRYVITFDPAHNEAHLLDVSTKPAAYCVKRFHDASIDGVTLDELQAAITHNEMYVAARLRAARLEETR